MTFATPGALEAISKRRLDDEPYVLEATSAGELTRHRVGHLTFAGIEAHAIRP
jgi:hypothetical protein